MMVTNSRFEKVSLDQYVKDTLNNINPWFIEDNVRNYLDMGYALGKQTDIMVITKTYDNIEIPQRATMGSAGYDFVLPYTVSLKPGSSVVVSTGIKCKLPPEHFLMIVPRSGLGFKYGIRLSNTIGIIDQDYYNNEGNEGHILVKLMYPYIDEFTTDKITLEAGTKFCQGIILPFCVMDEESSSKKERTGGFGSTSESEIDFEFEDSNSEDH